MYKRHSFTKNRKKIIKALALTRRLLLSLAEGGRDSNILNPFPYWQRDWTREDKEYAEMAQRKRAIRQLKDRQFIEIRKQGNAIMYRLTAKGRVAALKDMIRFADRRRDGRVVLVSFDIPEQENTLRVKLRYLLKDLKFEMIQRSLWKSDLDIASIISQAIADTKADKWVKVFESLEVKKKE